jgi:hypothetical protein
MNIEQLHDWASAECGGPAIGALPGFVGDKPRPHKGGGGSTTTTQSIPNELKPLAAKYASDATNLSNQAYTPYTGERFAGQNWVQDTGNQMAIKRAANGDPTINAGANYLRGQLGAGEQSATANPAGGVSAGKNQYMGKNPYLDQMVGRAQDSVRSQFNTGAVNSGSFGNSGLQEQFQKGLSDTASQMYGADYANTQQLAEAGVNRNLQAQQFNSQQGNEWAQRNDQVKQSQDANQMSAAQLGQQYGNQAYTDADQFTKAGQVYQDQDQQQRDFNYQQFQDQQNDPYKKLAAMSGVFSSGLGGTSSSKQSGGGK